MGHASEKAEHSGTDLPSLVDRALAVPTWTEVRDLAVRHPSLLACGARQELERRAASARENDDEGQALEVELMRDTLDSWSQIPLAALRRLDVEQPVPDGVLAAVALSSQFESGADPDDATAAARSWLRVVSDPAFDALPMGARAGFLIDGAEACRAAYLATTDPDLLDALLAIIDRLIHAQIPPTAVPAALVRWGEALALRYWAYDDPADARSALAAFRQAYERTPRNTAARSVHLAHYAKWLRACSVAARKHIAPLPQVSWEQSLARAIDLLRAELATASAAAIGVLRYELAICLEEFGEDSDLAILAEALSLAEQANSGLDRADDRLGCRCLTARLAGQLHLLTGEGDPAKVSGQFREATSQAAAVGGHEASGIARAWGRWALRQSRPAEAVEAFESGIRVGELILSQQVSWQDREMWLDYPQSLVPDLALALAMNGQPERAVEVLEDGCRGRLAGGWRLSHDMRSELAGLHPDLLARLDDAQGAMRAALLASTSAGPGAGQPRAEIRAAVRVAGEALAAVEAEITLLDPGYGQRLSYAQIAESVTGQPLVYLAAAETSGLILMIDPVTKNVSCELPGELCSDGLLGPLTRYLRAAGSWQAAGQAGPGQWLAADWQEVLESTADWLGETMLWQLLTISASRSAIRIVSVGQLGLLPVHLARRRCPSAPTGYRYLTDERTISILPSGSSLQNGPRPPGRPLSAVIIHSRDSSLPAIGAEVHAVANAFGPRARSMPAETVSRDTVLAALRDVDVVHVACHGVADPLRPLESALLLGQSERVTVRDLLAERKFSPSLVVLSACQSAMNGMRLPDETLSLPGVLLQAGAGSAIGSLWAVPDAPTALLMARFYELWLTDGHEPPEALRLAQIWLRDSANGQRADRFSVLDRRTARVLAGTASQWKSRRSYSRLDCWAGFVFTGAWEAQSSAGSASS